MIYNPVTATEGKKPFAVCCKGLYFPTVDLSLRLVEWIEVQRALGAEKISLSLLEVHPNMMKVVSSYHRGLRPLLMFPLRCWSTMSSLATWRSPQSVSLITSLCLYIFTSRNITFSHKTLRWWPSMIASIEISTGSTGHIMSGL